MMKLLSSRLSWIVGVILAASKFEQWDDFILNHTGKLLKDGVAYCEYRRIL